LDLDPVAITGLRTDSLLISSEQNDKFVAPAHDVLEDWAILRWIEEQHATSGGSYRELFEAIGSHPALRRGYRKSAPTSPGTSTAALGARPIVGERQLNGRKQRQIGNGVVEARLS
jgi:hypothetical protein